MRLFHLLLGATLVVSAVPGIAAVAPSGDPVLYWNDVFLGGVPFNPGQQRPAALLNIALHDAVNATSGRPDYSYLKGVPTTAGDTRVAAAVAAHDVLLAVNPGRAAEWNASLAASLALVPDGAAKTLGMSTGATVAMLALANRANDGTFTPRPTRPSGLPGRWAPTPPGFGPPVQPELADVTPWVMASGSQFRPVAPPAIGSAAYATAYTEVQSLGSATSLTRSADQTAAALFWASASGPGPWLRAAIDGATNAGLSTIENARLFGLLGTSVGDAIIAAWDAKYTYDYWRPVTGIRAGDDDGNPGSVGDAGWTPLLGTPPHPSYISAHATVGGAATTILAAFLGDATNFCVASGGSTRCWASFSDAVAESSQSRIWGGIHWRFDSEAGLEAGRALGRYNLGTHAFDAVPEPATWGMMLLGFGLVGAVVRRRQALAVPA